MNVKRQTTGFLFAENFIVNRSLFQSRISSNQAFITLNPVKILQNLFY